MAIGFVLIGVAKFMDPSWARGFCSLGLADRVVVWTVAADYGPGCSDLLTLVRWGVPNRGGVSMYIVAQHVVSNPVKFWDRADRDTIALPSHLKLHHCFPNADGTRAVCVWEAESVESLERFFANTGLNESSTNTFFPVENKDGIALPASLLRVSVEK